MVADYLLYAHVSYIKLGVVTTLSMGRQTTDDVYLSHLMLLSLCVSSGVVHYIVLNSVSTEGITLPSASAEKSLTFWTTSSNQRVRILQSPVLMCRASKHRYDA